jgi:hypothetical protein
VSPKSKAVASPKNKSAASPKSKTAASPKSKALSPKDKHSAGPAVPHKATAAPVEYEFFGPVGVAVIMLLLPTATYALYGLCTAQGCTLLPPVHASWDAWSAFWSSQTLLSWEAVVVVAGWLAVQLVLFALVPGPVVAGQTLPDGAVPLYRLNGLASFLLLTALTAVAQWQGWIDLAWAHTHFVELLTATTLLAIGLSVYVYAISFQPGERLAHSGNTGTVSEIRTPHPHTRSASIHPAHWRSVCTRACSGQRSDCGWGQATRCMTFGWAVRLRRGWVRWTSSSSVSSGLA